MKANCLLMVSIATIQLVALAQDTVRPEEVTKAAATDAQFQTDTSGSPDAGIMAKAKGGDREAQYSLGIMYCTGNGVAKDLKAACQWLKLAAEQGHASAQYSLGMRYMAGEGVARDNAEACKWLKLAAEQGHSLAQYSLGVRFIKGEGVEKDYTQAVKWFRKAAHHGVAAAQYSLGIRYTEGIGVPRDRVEAYRWFVIAEAQGNQAAKKAREHLEGNSFLAAEEVIEAKSRAEEFVPQQRSQ